MRRLVLLLLIALLPLQSLHAAVGLVQPVGGDTQHWVDHQWGVSHHHHDDGSVHHDDSDESKRHVSPVDACHSPAAPARSVGAMSLPVWAQAPPVFRAPFISDPFLQGPKRPPQALA